MKLLTVEETKAAIKELEQLRSSPNIRTWNHKRILQLQELIEIFGVKVD